MTEDEFYSRYNWCLNPILSIRDLLQRLNEELEFFPQLSGWQREESKINLYLFACALVCTADDYFASRLIDLASLRARAPRLGPAFRAAEWFLNRIEWFFHVADWRAWTWRKRVDRCVDAACRLLIAEPSAEAERFDALREAARPVVSSRLPNRMLERRMRLPEAFRGQDMSHHDVILLAERFRAAHQLARERVVFVGLRTAGAYFAPLMAAYLKAHEWPVTGWFSIRPKNRTSRAERRALHSLARSNARVILVDDYPATGNTLRIALDLLQRFQIKRDRLTILAPTHRAQPDWVRLAGVEGTAEFFTVHPEELHKTALLLPERVESICREYYGADAGIVPDELLDEINRRLAEHSRDGHHVREKRVYAMRISTTSSHRTKKVFLKSVGWGWLGYHACIAGKRLTSFVPPVAGLRNGLLVSDWIDEEQHTASGRPDMTAVIAAYVAARARQLSIPRGCHLENRTYRWTGSDELVTILRAAYGPYVSRLKAGALRKQLRRFANAAPAVVDGRMGPDEWIHAGERTYKIDFEHHGFGGAEVDLIDPAYDLAAACLQFRLTKTSEQQLLETYAQRSGDSAIFERILLYKILYGTRVMKHAAQAAGAGKNPEANHNEYQFARNFLVYAMNDFCSRFVTLMRPRWFAPLFFMDLDGVFDHALLGFPHATESGLRSLELLRTRGHAVVLNTGRGVQDVRNYCAAYGIPGGIAEYGSVFVDAVSDREVPLIDETALKQLDACREMLRKLPGVFIDSGYEFSVRAYRYKGRRTEGLTKAEIDPLLKNPEFSKLTSIMREADTYFVQKHSSKGRAVRFVKRYLGNTTPSAAIGDSREDISMLRAVEYAYAPANCAPAIREAFRKKRECRILNQSFQNGLLSAVRHRLGNNAEDCRGEFFKVTETPAHLNDLIQTLLRVADRRLAPQLLAVCTWWSL